MSSRVQLGRFLFEYNVRNKQDEDIPVYSVTNSQGFCQQYFKKVVASENRTTYKIVPKGYFAYNPSRINVGSIDWQRNEAKVIVSPLYVVFKTNEALDNQFLYYYLKSDVALTYIKNLAQGSVRDNLKFAELSKLPIRVDSICEQQRKAKVLDVISALIDKRKQQILKLDELVKSRFIEMFGDPVINTRKFELVTLKELADIKIGPFGSLMHKSDYIEGGHPLVNPSHIIDSKIVPDNHLTIDDRKYNELEAYHLHIGDVVLGRRGEMGRCAVVSCEGALCGTGSLFIRTKGRVTADYIQKVISYPTYKKKIEDLSVGQTMQNLNVPIVSQFEIPVPPVEIQKAYYTFVEVIDKSKTAIQKSLDDLETLKKSLMQQYFA